MPSLRATSSVRSLSLAISSAESGASASTQPSSASCSRCGISAAMAPSPVGQDDARRVLADEFDDRGGECRAVSRAARQHHVAGRVAGAEGQDGKRRIALDEALAQGHAQPGPAKAPGTGQALLVAGVEDQDVVAVMHVRPDGSCGRHCR